MMLASSLLLFLVVCVCVPRVPRHIGNLYRLLASVSSERIVNPDWVLCCYSG